ncbi:hypothetical protein Trydic_g15229, partial [Trypoxylus dichotomus]
LDIDTSSFYPDATSSRRFSSDLNDEHSNDSLFTAKTNVNSFQPNIPPSITEDSEESFSKVDITPSGKLDDLYSEASISRISKSVSFEDNISVKNEEEQRRKQEIDTTKTTDASENLSKHGIDDVKIGNPKPALLKKPNLGKKVSLSQEKDEVIVPDNNEDTKSKGDLASPHEQKSDANKGQPQKLKHKLDINVFALLPGAGKPPKKEKIEEVNISQPRQRSASLNSEEHESDTLSQIGHPKEVTPPKEVTLPKEVTPPKELTPPSAAIENTIADVEVLESVTKTRARGPVKRRPSTKRGRDAIRNSCIDFTFANNSSIEDYHNKVNKGNSNENQQTFKNDLEAKFDQHPKGLTDSTKSTKLETSNSVENVENINNGEESAPLVEKEKNSTSKLENHPTLEAANPPRKNLFSDDTDSDDLFSNSKVKKPEKIPSNTLPKKAGLFDVSRRLSSDEDENQDVFGQKQTVSSLKIPEDSSFDKEHSESIPGSKDKLKGIST